MLYVVWVQNNGQVCAGLHWVVASQLPSSSHHLVISVLPTFEIVGLVTGPVPLALGWSLTGVGLALVAITWAALAAPTRKALAPTPASHSDAGGRRELQAG